MEEHAMQRKRWICGLLALVMVLMLLPVKAKATQQGVITGKTYGKMTSQLAISTPMPTGPALSEGNHVRWIDRMADLPKFATDFYAWLEANATADGALADPTKGTVFEGPTPEQNVYAYPLHTLEGSADFIYTGTAHKTAAENAILNDIGDAHSQIVSYAGQVYGAFDRDHPEVFWLSGNCVYGYSIPYDYDYQSGKGTVKYEVQLFFYLKAPDFDIRNPDYQSAAAVAEAIETQEAAVRNILADAPPESNYALLRYFNRVLTQTNVYNGAIADNNQSAASPDAWKGISALKGSTGVEGPVCEGYARAMMILCQAVGIPCVVVEGPGRITPSSSPIIHMWNYVQLEGNWYAIDVTWNDPYSYSMPDTACTGLETEDWFLMGSNTMAKTGITFGASHTVTNYTTTDSLCYVNGPVLSAEAYVPGQALTQPTVTLKYPTVSFEDVIVMNVYYTAENLEDVEEMGLITYSRNVSEWNVDTAEAVLPGHSYDEGKQMYMSSTNGIAAKNLGDTLYFAVYAKLTDGSYVYTKLVSYSPETYAYAQLSTGSADVKPLVVAMLKYGAAAQAFFNHNTGSPVDRKLTAEQLALIESYRPDMMAAVATPSSEKQGVFLKTGGYVNRYPTVSFEGAFCINYYCTPGNVPVDGITMYCWNQADYDAAQVLTAENATAALLMDGSGTGSYTAALDGIAAKDLDKGIYVAFVYSDGTSTWTSGVLAYSIGTYCVTSAASGTDVAPLAQATAVYGYHAKQTFYNA